MSGQLPASTSWRSSIARGSTRCRSGARPVARTCAGSPRWGTYGSTRASFPSRRSAGRARSGSPQANATGAARGLTTADLPDHAYWEEWFPGGLGVGDARADPALVLRAALHVGHPRRQGPIPPGALLREAPRRDRPRDARQPRQCDRRGRGLRAHGRRRHALDVLRAAAEPEHPLRVRAGRRRQAPSPDALELGVLPRHVRRHRGVPTDLRRPRPRGARSDCAAAPRPLAPGSGPGLPRRGRAGVRRIHDGRGRPRARVVRRRSLELVHPSLPAALLRTGRRCVPDALVRARAGAPRVLADHAVSDRAPVGKPRGRRL